MSPARSFTSAAVWASPGRAIFVLLKRNFSCFRIRLWMVLTKVAGASRNSFRRPDAETAAIDRPLLLGWELTSPLEAASVQVPVWEYVPWRVTKTKFVEGREGSN